MVPRSASPTAGQDSVGPHEELHQPVYHQLRTDQGFDPHLLRQELEALAEPCPSSSCLRMTSLLLLSSDWLIPYGHGERFVYGRLQRGHP